MKIAVIGIGVVGEAVSKFFERDAEVIRFSRTLEKEGKATKEQGNDCAVAFVCVPTPMYPDKYGVNLTALEGVIGWLKTPIIVIKSTVPVGTTRRLAEETGKVILHNPEFLTERDAYNDMLHPGRCLIGAPFVDLKPYADVIQKVYQHYYGPHVKYYFISSDHTEFIKYVTNAYLATKVTFCNEIKEIADSLSLDYDIVRELWLLDERVGRDHTLVNDGYGGMCLPKDVKGLIGFTNNEFFKLVHNENERFKKS